jgi:hypothetical protein
VQADPVQLQVPAHLQAIPNSGHIALFHDKPPLGITLTPHVIVLQTATWQKKNCCQNTLLPSGMLPKDCLPRVL